MNTKTYRTILNLKNTDIALLILRLGVGGLMLTHGIPKLINLFDNNPIRFADPLGIGVEGSLALAVFSEVICSVLIIIGLGTRLAVIPLFFTMFVAFFVVQGADPFKTKELAMFFMIVYLALFLTGSGKYSLDQYFLNRKKG